ncbi:MAG: DNA polymerase III subunit delta' [Rudaea sp.]
MSLAPWHADSWQRLLARRAQGRLPHALLLCGPAGLGKRVFADAFAAALLCEHADEAPCGQCRACRLVHAGSHPDKVRISFDLRDDGKLRTEIIVDQMRALSARLAMTAQFGGLQIALIDPADAMNANAANALLKTLEEPTPATVIVLLADRPARLPATIRSRCQRIDFSLPPEEQALAWLRAQEIDARTATAALAAAGGNPGMALELARSGGLALRAEVDDDLRALAAGKAAASAIANRWSKSEPEQRLWFAALLVERAAADTALALTARADLPKLAAGFDRINRAREHLRGPLRPELVILDALSALA